MQPGAIWDLSPFHDLSLRSFQLYPPNILDDLECWQSEADYIAILGSCRVLQDESRNRFAIFQAFETKIYGVYNQYQPTSEWRIETGNGISYWRGFGLDTKVADLQAGCFHSQL